MRSLLSPLSLLVWEAAAGGNMSHRAGAARREHDASFRHPQSRYQSHKRSFDLGCDNSLFPMMLVGLVSMPRSSLPQLRQLLVVCGLIASIHGFRRE